MRVLGLWNTRHDHQAGPATHLVGIEVHVSELRKGDVIWGTTYSEYTNYPLNTNRAEFCAMIDRIEEGEDENGKFFMLYYDDEHQPARLAGGWAKVRTTNVERGVSYSRPAIITIVDVNNEREEFLKQNPDYVERDKPAILGRGFGRGSRGPLT